MPRNKGKNRGNKKVKKQKKDEEEDNNPAVATGVLSSEVMSRDVKIDHFSITLNGAQLVNDTTLKLNWGRRYGLIGLNGTGKSTLLKCLGQRLVPIPEHFNIYHLTSEVESSEKTPMDVLLEDVEATTKRLEAEMAELLSTEEGQTSERLLCLYEMLDEIDAQTAPSRAGRILNGLGFTREMMEKQCKDFSGGWRMRVALAKALFIKPDILLLDEPTNHLDLEACVWLEEYLKYYNRILLLISHSQDFLNGVCDKIMHLQNGKLSYYTGNYDTYVKSRREKEEHQTKRYQSEQAQIADIKNYIARFGHGSAKLAKQAKSRQKLLDKMVSGGLTEQVIKDRVLNFYFPDPGTLTPPILSFTNVDFGYSKDKVLYKGLDFGVDLDSRIALVGPNGVGKSTLLKLMVGAIMPLDGMVRRHQHLRIGWFHQHLADALDPEDTPLKFIKDKFPDATEQEARAVIGRFGISGKLQLAPIKYLSDGQKSRVVLSYLSYSAPHLLLLDEPTNHLDLETIDSLAEAINDFEGGMVLVSHDFRLINQVAKEIWVCENQKVTPWKGDIDGYKQTLRERVISSEKKMTTVKR
eukprot:TRINITY_DN2378_c0_g2_i2.p1 TRINITY_DN2378_c0_g2~~TRINITY_DN2378_c0_g2_i2.p1  ORF type:complete len:580 (+),score=113.82 TRINITY_DN2378_c0_g2_i2:97-1836(+)